MRATALAAMLLAAALALAGCGAFGDVRDFVEDRYQLQDRSGDTATYLSRDPVGTTTAAIVAAHRPATRDAQGGSEYLRYDEDIVIVGPSGSGSRIRVEDLDGRYRSGYYVFLGPGFNPASPAGAVSGGGPGDSK